MPRAELDDLHHKTLEYIKAYQRDHRARPSYRQIGLALGFSHSMASFIVMRLEAYGYIELDHAPDGRIYAGRMAIIKEPADGR